MSNEVFSDVMTDLFAELEALQELLAGKDPEELYEEYYKMLALEAFIDDLDVKYCGGVY